MIPVVQPDLIGENRRFYLSETDDGILKRDEDDGFVTDRGRAVVREDLRDEARRGPFREVLPIAI